ncbi:MAG TPA: BON domain-containing protein [Bryobacteraceae bacterium]|nr:BON domain-containing protein [Bryobacteraceae bacterium]HUO31157.1 BON domain-containing protein [Bryobacteraceae bacterium]
MRKAFIVLTLLACSLGGLAGPLTKSHSQGKFSDAEVEATIKAKLEKSKIGKDGFQVHVKDGIATWTGTTAVMQHKGAATRMAKAAGAIHVVNNIKVSESARQKGGSSPAAEPRHVQVKTN